jgi:hypothetical protein
MRSAHVRRAGTELPDMRLDWPAQDSASVAGFSAAKSRWRQDVIWGAGRAFMPIRVVEASRRRRAPVGSPCARLGMGTGRVMSCQRARKTSAPDLDRAGARPDSVDGML